MARWNSWLPRSPEKPAVASPAQPEISELRERMVEVLSDCEGASCARLRAQLVRSRSAQDLWMSRMDVYQLVAREHCESVAARRLNALIPLFETSLPQRMLRELPC